MSICATVKTQKLYYLSNTRSAYIPINGRLHRERERESKRERLCPSMKQCKHRNGTISVIQDMHISLSIGDCVKGEREAMSICEMVKTQEWYYLHNMRSGYFPINKRLHRERARDRLCPPMKW